MHLRKISSAPQVALESLSFNNVRWSTVEMAELKQQQQQRRGQRERCLKKLQVKISKTIILFYNNCKFLCHLCMTTTWKGLIKISPSLEDVNKWHQFSFSLPVLWYSPLGFFKFMPEKKKNLTKRMTWNNGDEVCNTVNSCFYYRQLSTTTATATATAAKTSLLKWIHLFVQFVENVKCRRISLQLILGDRTQV